MKINKKDVDLYSTITCGQIFRYKKNKNSYILFLDDRVVKVIDDGNYLEVYSNVEDNLEEKITNYLDLNRDYDKINEYLIKIDPNLEDMINNCNGFKVMRTPKLETIISYMISANNSVYNISKCVNELCNKYGDKVIFEGNEYHLFPSLDKLKTITLEEYKKLKLGFRASYIYNFVQKINYDDIDYIDKLNTKDAINYLMSYNGIGLKIASCILLFGYQRLDVFPIDIWVKKYMQDVHNIIRISEIKTFAKEKYGEYSGLVLQYMFHKKRNKNEKTNF